MVERKRHPSLERLLEFTAAHGVTGPSSLAAALNESEQTLTNWGTRGVSKTGAIKAQFKFGCNAHWVVTGEGSRKLDHDAAWEPEHSRRREQIPLTDNPEYPAIRRVSLKAQAGVSGYAVEHVDDDGPPIVFRADWYKAKGYRPERMLAMRVTGDSMIPNMYDGDLIVINTEQTTPKQGVAFLASYEGEVVVKRLVRDDGLWWLTSDNPDQRRYPRTKCNGGTQIIGEVVYRQTERI